MGVERLQESFEGAYVSNSSEDLEARCRDILQESKNGVESHIQLLVCLRCVCRVNCDQLDFLGTLRSPLGKRVLVVDLSYQCPWGWKTSLVREGKLFSGILAKIRVPGEGLSDTCPDWTPQEKLSAGGETSRAAVE